MINAVIIDDEEQCSETLARLLDLYCPGVKLLAQCNDSRRAKSVIEKTNAALVFLDVEMPGMSGFDLLAQIKPINFEVIFTTAHDQYAIQAIRFSALDFLLKPIGRKDLEQAVKRAELKESIPDLKIENLLYNINYLNRERKMALPTLTGLEFIALGDILRCESDNNYTIFHLLNKRKIVVSKTLKEYEDMLEDYSFFRIHQSHLINLRYIKTYTKGEGGIVTMEDNSVVEVSRRKKEEFMKRLPVF